MEHELKPCPFCGKSVAVCCTLAEVECIDKDHPYYALASKQYDVVCNYNNGGCGASCGGSHRTPESAIKHWNRRANNG